MTRPRITLDQLLVFQTIVDEGGFANAAEKLGRSQSTLSYSIHKLEDLLDTQLLEIVGRKAQLTESGRQILHDARQLTQSAIALEHEANNQTKKDSEIRLVYDAICPKSIIYAALDAFSQSNPSTRLTIREAALSGPVEYFKEDRVDIAIVTKVPHDIIGKKLLEVESIAYAHPGHALHQLNRPLTESDLQIHRHIVLMDSARKSNRSEGWLGAQHIWNVDNMQMKIDCVANGLGFAWLPKRLVDQCDVNLKPLPLVEGASRHFPLYMISQPKKRNGSACANLISLIEACAAE